MRTRAGATLLALALLAAACGDGAATTTAVAAASPETVAPERALDIQGHRGARGLRPENTLPSFQAALEVGVNTLELDLHFTADDQVVVWHDPVVDTSKCDVAGALWVRSATAADLAALTCDRNPDPSRFPDQQAPDGDYSIVTLGELFDFVALYGDTAVRFNIETKRKRDDPGAIGDGFDGVAAGPFELAILALVRDRGLIDRVTVQSFDHRSLWALHAVEPDLELAALTRRGDIPDFADLVARGAAVWSPDYRSVSAGTLTAAHDAGLRVIPWTVNDPAEMGRLVDLGVDGIITDRPDLATGL